MADISIGNLYAELSFDTSGLEKGKAEAIQHYKKLKAEEERITKEAGENVTENLKIKIKELQENQTQALKIIEGFDADIKKKRADDLKAMGDSLMSHVVGPLKSFAEDAIATFANFEQSMQNVFSVMGASESDMQLLTETAKKMGETTRFSASQAAQALYSLGSAGQSATEATKSLQGVLRLAGATGSDLAYTSETIASTLSQFNLEAGKAGHIADVFSMAISKSQANMTKLSYSMKYVGPVASGLGVSLETTTAALMQLYNTGFGGEQAGTYLRNALQKLASGTEDLKNKLEALGIAYEDVNPQTNNFANILDTLKEHGVGVTEAISIFGEASGGAMAKLIEQGGSAVATMEGVLINSEGAAESMQKIQNTSFANTQAELASAFEAVKISVGEILMPAINFIAQGFTTILQTINNLPIGIKTFAVAIGVVVAAIGVLFTLPALISTIKAAMIALNTTMMSNPIFLAAAVIATVAAAAYSLFKQVESYNKELAEQAKKDMEDIKEAKERAEEAGNKGRAIEDLISRYEALRNKTNKTKEEQDEYNNVLGRLVELVPDVVTSIDETGEAFVANLERVRLAKNKQLLLEKEQNALAIEKAEKLQTRDETQLKNINAEINRYKNEKNTYGLFKGLTHEKAVDKALEIANKIRNKIYEGRLNNNKNFINEILEKYPILTFPGVDAEKTILDFMKGLEDNALKAQEKYYALEDQKLEIEKRKIELFQLKSKQAQIEAIAKETELKTKAQIVDDAIAEAENNYHLVYNNYSVRGLIDKRKEKALEAKVEELETQLMKKLKSKLKGIDIKDKDFDWTFENGDFSKDEDLQRLRALLIKTRKELENEKNNNQNKSKNIKTQKNASEQEEKKSIAEELEMLDRLYDERIKKAKEYGKDVLGIQIEWQQKRLAFLESLYEKEKEIELKNSKTKLDKKEITKAQYDKEIEAIEKKYQTEEALAQHLNKVLDEKKEDKTNGVTISDEFTKTYAIMLELRNTLAISNEAFNQKKEEFYNILGEINSLRELSQLEPSETFLTNQIEEAEGKAKALSEELKIAYMSQKDLNALVESFQQKNEVGFIGKIKNIKKEEAEAISKITEAQGIDDEAKKKAIKEIQKESRKALATTSAQLAEAILKVGESFSNMIIDVMENSKDEFDASAKIISWTLAQLKNSIQDPLAKAIIGGVAAAFNIITMIINYAKKKEEERKKDTADAREKAYKEDQERAKRIAGDSAKEYAKHYASAMKGVGNTKDLFQAQYDKMLNNHVNRALEELGDAKTDLLKWQESGYEKDEWYWEGARVRKGKHWIDASSYVAKTMNDLWEEYYEALKKGDKGEAQRIEDDIKRNQQRLLKEKGIREEDLNGLHKYMQDMNSIYLEAIQAQDLSTVGVSFKEKMRSAIVEKLKARMFKEKINELINKYEKNPSEDNLNKLIEEAERVATNYERELKKLAGALGVANTEMDEHIKRWADMKKGISDALTDSLSESAYNADWSSFKKAFASEMKKAIVDAVISQAGIRTKITALVKGIMEDGQITKDEINNSLNELRGIYDGVEGSLESVAAMLKKLDGEVNVKQEVQGSIIQKLSGADRDYFSDLFKDNFRLMLEGFNSAILDLKEIRHAQITVLNATLNVDTVNLYATDNMSLREFLAELINEARQAG